jgi:hypothetical protein
VIHNKKTISVVGGYYEYLHSSGVKPVQNGERREHCMWMCKQVLTDGSAFGDEKASRWLGFVQGWLVVEGDFSIDDCRDHCRSGSVKGFKQDTSKPFTMINVLTIVSGIGLPGFDIAELHSCVEQLLGGPVLSDEIGSYLADARAEVLLQHPALKAVDSDALRAATRGLDREERIQECMAWTEKTMRILNGLGYVGLIRLRKGGF